MTFRDSEHYLGIERRMDAEIAEKYDGDIVAYARREFDHDGSLAGRKGLGRVVIERLCEEVERSKERI